MDIDDLYTVPHHEKGAELQLFSPVDGKKIEVFLMLRGVDSAAFRSAEISGKREVALIIKNDDLSDDEKAQKQLEVIAGMLARITLGWRGLTSKRKKLGFNHEAATNLYLNSPAIAKQVDKFVSNRKNFTKG